METQSESSNYVEMAQTALDSWVEKRPSTASVDTETSGVTYFDEAFAITVAFGEGADSDPEAHYFEVACPEALEAVRRILNETPTWVFHNAKFDLQKLILAGVVEHDALVRHAIHDTEAVAHLLDENSGKRLKDLAVRWLDWDDTIEVPLKSDPTRTRLVSREKYELDQARRELKIKISDGFDKLPREVLIPYALRDADFTLRLFNKLYPMLENQDEDLRALYAREMELTLVLLDVEMAGLGVDVEYLTQISKQTATQMLQQELLIQKLTGKEFVDHHAWIREAFAEHGITLPDTQKDTLKEYEHPLAQAILEYRRLRKLYSTYLSAMLSEQRDGVLHPGFRQHGTRTGRMSSGGVIE